MMTVKSRTEPITKDKLPKGVWWGKDGDAWACENDPQAEQGWRWVPKNSKALALDAPSSEMVDHYPFGGFS